MGIIQQKYRSCCFLRLDRKCQGRLRLKPGGAGFFAPFALLCIFLLAMTGPVRATEFLVNTTTLQSQTDPSVAALSGGDFVIAWVDGSSTVGDTSTSGLETAIRAQRFDLNDVKQGVEFLVNTTTADDQLAPCAAGLSGGGLVIAWMDRSSGFNNENIRAQRFDVNGIKTGAELLVNATTASRQSEPAAAALTGGSFIIAWQDKSASGGDTSQEAIRAQRFNASGVPQGGEFLVNTTTAGAQTKPGIAALAGGGFVIVWEDFSQTGGDSVDRAIRAQRYNAAGIKQGGEFLVNTTTSGKQSEPSVAPLQSGGFVVAWQDFSQTGGDTTGIAIRAQRFNASGVAQGGEFLVNTITTNDQQNPNVAELSGGGFVIAWEDLSGAEGGTTVVDVRAQRYGSSGVAEGGEFLVNTTTFLEQRTPSAAGLSGDRIIIA